MRHSRSHNSRYVLDGIVRDATSVQLPNSRCLRIGRYLFAERHSAAQAEISDIFKSSAIAAPSSWTRVSFYFAPPQKPNMTSCISITLQNKSPVSGQMQRRSEFGAIE